MSNTTKGKRRAWIAYWVTQVAEWATTSRPPERYMGYALIFAAHEDVARSRGEWSMKNFMILKSGKPWGVVGFDVREIEPHFLQEYTDYINGLDYMLDDEG